MEISVIVPAYNAAPFLRDCLDNLLAQDFDDYEIIIVNDGSKDDTAAILSEIKDPRVRVIHQENSGAYRARRSGILAADGKYIAFCDADDVPRRNWLSVLYKKAAETGADITVCGYSRVEEKTGRVIAKEMCLSAVVETDEDKLPLLFLNTGLCNKFFSAHLLREVYCLENPPRISEDAIFLANIYPNVNRVAFVQDSL
ncbi:MAG: glycosyltransferase, partial [Oscillospiraceae bacterium]|nr:glycosyltransferase [Oscillospiraceae bacterium]